MSEKAQNKLLITLGVVTALTTIGIQVMSVGEIKGRTEAIINVHQQRLDLHEGKIDEHTKDISEIKGTLSRVATSTIKK
jgi:hypothetical protein